MTTEREYIGDGVYASYDGFHIVLTAERDGRTETIFLDPYAYIELTKFAAKVA